MDNLDNLLDQILTRYHDTVNSDKQLKTLFKACKSAQATYTDLHNLAIRLGEVGADSISSVLLKELQATEVIFYDTAQKLVSPIMSENYNALISPVEDVQDVLNREAGISLKTLLPPKNRVYNAIYIQDIANTPIEQLGAVLIDKLVKSAQTVVDDALDTNAKAHYQAGLGATITRINTGSNVCSNCKSVAGTYDYSEAPDNIFLRHRDCRCITVYKPNKQAAGVDVHTKKAVKL